MFKIAVISFFILKVKKKYYLRERVVTERRILFHDRQDRVECDWKLGETFRKMQLRSVRMGV